MHATEVASQSAGSRSPLRVHCDVGPVLINRTAAYHLCRLIPPALMQRGFQVTTAALLARLCPGADDADAAFERLLRRRSSHVFGHTSPLGISRPQSTSTVCG